MGVDRNEEMFQAEVYCPICTHTVGAQVSERMSGLRSKNVVLPGQKCSRCWTSLDAAYIVKLLGPVPQEAPPPSRNPRRKGLAA